LQGVPFRVLAPHRGAVLGSPVGFPFFVHPRRFAWGSFIAISLIPSPLVSASYGGANGAGTVFKLAPSGGGWTYTDLYDFTTVSGGDEPGSNVVFDSQGNLYGTAQYGGTGSCGQLGCGVVWEITP